MENLNAMIPFPAKITQKNGSFSLSNQLTVSGDEANQENIAWLQKILRDAVGFKVDQVSQDGQIQLSIDPAHSGLGREGYRLVISSEAINLQALTKTGIFYAIQTLGQMLPVGSDALSMLEVPAVEIVDQPRYEWRGFMLDEGRHFHGIHAVKRLLDMMAALKMNIFHWHLTEDQGWRIEIKKYPRLTEIGSIRVGTGQSFLDIIRKRHDGIPHQGYYTQEQIREVVAYAAERHIAVVPEIEMPGHSVAALAAYPEFSCRGVPLEVRTGFGISKDVYCIGNEAVFGFIEDILNEVLELFPGNYIHLGGDETPRSRWKECPKCQLRMAEQGFCDVSELHGYMINRITNYLTSRGREVIGWNENLVEGLHPDFIIHYWFRGERAAAEAVREGRQVILSPFFDYYLDHSYSLTPLSRTYLYQPGFEGLNKGQTASILGVEAALWTEFVPNQARLDYQVFPRLLAIAESAWTPEDRKDYDDFIARYRCFQDRLHSWGVDFAPDTQIEPGWWKRLFGFLTIALRQTGTAGSSS
jgi:hexosaminidase